MMMKDEEHFIAQTSNLRQIIHLMEVYDNNLANLHEGKFFDQQQIQNTYWPQ